MLIACGFGLILANHYKKTYERRSDELVAQEKLAHGANQKANQPSITAKQLPSATAQSEYVSAFLSGELHKTLSEKADFEGPVFFFNSFNRQNDTSCYAVFSALKNRRVKYIDPVKVAHTIEALKEISDLAHCPVPKAEGYGVGYQFIQHNPEIEAYSEFGRLITQRNRKRGFRPSLFVMNANVALFDVHSRVNDRLLISSDEFCRNTDEWDDWNDTRSTFGIRPCIRPVYMEFSPDNCRVHRVIERFGRFQSPEKGDPIKVLQHYGRGDGERMVPKVSSGVFQYSGQYYYFNLGYATKTGLVGRVAVLRFGRLFDDKNNPASIPDCEYTTYLLPEEARRKRGKYVDVNAKNVEARIAPTSDALADDFINIASSTRNFLKFPNSPHRPPSDRCMRGMAPVSYLKDPVEWITLGSCLDTSKPAPPFIARWGGPIRIGFDWTWASLLFSPEEEGPPPKRPVIDPEKAMNAKQLQRYKVQQQSKKRKITLEHVRHLINPDSPESIYHLKQQVNIRQIVEKAVPELRELTGLNIEIVTGADSDKANFIIRPGGPLYFKGNVFRMPSPITGRGGEPAMTNIFEGRLSGAVRMAPFARSQVDGYFIPDPAGLIQQAVCHVYRELPDKLLEGLVQECLVRGMGLPNLSKTSQNSLLGPWARIFEPVEAGSIYSRGPMRGYWGRELMQQPDRWGEYSTRLSHMGAPGISAFERSMLGVLYGPKVRPGMPVSQLAHERNQLLKIFNEIRKKEEAKW